MKILVPVDASEDSDRALEFAATFAKRFDAELHVVHFSDAETDATDAVLENAAEILESRGVEAEPELNIRDISLRPEDRVGREIVALATEGDYDHVIMGRHGAGRVERAMLGSATQTVLDAGTVALTVVP